MANIEISNVYFHQGASPLSTPQMLFASLKPGFARTWTLSALPLLITVFIDVIVLTVGVGACSSLLEMMSPQNLLPKIAVSAVKIFGCGSNPKILTFPLVSSAPTAPRNWMTGPPLIGLAVSNAKNLTAINLFGVVILISPLLEGISFLMICVTSLTLCV